MSRGGLVILSQLVDADELKALSPEELRNMILKLDDEVVYGSSEVLTAAKSGEESTETVAEEENPPPAVDQS
jgi:hypothetical protein